MRNAPLGAPRTPPSGTPNFGPKMSPKMDPTWTHFGPQMGPQNRALGPQNRSSEGVAFAIRLWFENWTPWTPFWHPFWTLFCSLLHLRAALLPASAILTFLRWRRLSFDSVLIKFPSSEASLFRAPFLDSFEVPWGPKMGAKMDPKSVPERPRKGSRK